MMTAAAGLKAALTNLMDFSTVGGANLAPCHTSFTPGVAVITHNCNSYSMLGS